MSQLLKLSNQTTVSASNDNIIYMNQENNYTRRRCVKEERRIILTLCKTKGKKCIAKLLKTSVGYLLEPIQRTSELTNIMRRRSSHTRGKLHVNLLLDITMKKGIRHIHLM